MVQEEYIVKTPRSVPVREATKTLLEVTGTCLSEPYIVVISILSSGCQSGVHLGYDCTSKWKIVMLYLALFQALEKNQRGASGTQCLCMFGSQGFSGELGNNYDKYLSHSGSPHNVLHSTSIGI